MRKAGAGRSNLEEDFSLQMRIAKLPTPIREHPFHPERKWRMDYAWPDQKVGAEIEGGIWVEGRHNRGIGFMKDCEKYNAAALLGWWVFRFPTNMVRDGTALNTISAALKAKQ